jgi:hypothetical protein
MQTIWFNFACLILPLPMSTYLRVRVRVCGRETERIGTNGDPDGWSVCECKRERERKRESERPNELAHVVTLLTFTLRCLD